MLLMLATVAAAPLLVAAVLVTGRLLFQKRNAWLMNGCDSNQSFAQGM